MGCMENPCLNPAFDNGEKVKKLYRRDVDAEEGDIRIIKHPFKAVKLRNFLKSPDFLKGLKQEVKSIPLHRKDNDLYSLSQSIDLNNVESPFVKKFVNFLSNDVRAFISKVFKRNFKPMLSITASLYADNDYLLCHDDKCEDRSVAFVFYLSSSGGLQSGGNFDMFDKDESGQPGSVTVSLPAELNSFLCFEVGNFTYHQVSEVKPSSFLRYSINGWFHSDEALQMKLLDYKDPLPKLLNQTIIEGFVLLDQFVNLSYCMPTQLFEMRSKFEDESCIMLPKFFTKHFYESAWDILKGNDISWHHRGPANRRNYETADISSLPSSLNSFVNFLRSSLFASYLRNISGLSIEPSIMGDGPTSQFILEVQRWRPGSYTMATDNDEFFERNGLDIYVFFGSESFYTEDTPCGQIIYLDALDKSGDGQLVNLEPKDNTLLMVYRTNDTVKFTKRINYYHFDHEAATKRVNDFEKSYYCIAITYYEEECENKR